MAPSQELTRPAVLALALLLAGTCQAKAECGIASWYGWGEKTANGEEYDLTAMTAAHRTLPFGSVVRVENLRNGREVFVRINDRGPFVEGRVIDLSLGAALEIGLARPGIAPVRITALDPRLAGETGCS